MEPEPLAVLLLIYDDPAENDRLALIGIRRGDKGGKGDSRLRLLNIS